MEIVEMIKNYYPKSWSREQVQKLLKTGKITVAQYLSVLPITDENPITDEMIDIFRASKLAELSAACNATIEQGIDVITSNSGKETEHFSLDSYDQNNIANMFYSVMAGIDEYPYHADGKECTTYNKADIVAIYVAAQSVITYHTTYNNMLRTLVNKTNDVEDLAAITYGMELPKDLNTSMQKNIVAAQAQIQKILATLPSQTTN